MKLLFVLEHYAPYIGGAETLFRDLCEALAERGHEVRVITTRFRPTLPVSEQLNGVRIERIRCRNRFLFSLYALPAVLRAARRADLVHTTTYNAAVPAWLGARWHGRRVVITFHEVWGDLWLRLPYLSRWRARLFHWYEQMVLRLPFDRYVAVSDFTARSLVQSGVERSKVRRIRNGLRTEDHPRRHQPPPVFTYTYFGRLGVSKGLDLLLPAAAAFNSSLPGARLRLIIPRTPAALYRTISGEIEQLGLGPQLELLHELPVPALRRAVAESSCVVIPSYSEGFCFAAVEAALAGVPIVSSGRGALPETVSGPHVVMREQSVAGLLEALERAYRGEWTYVPVRRFPLAASVAAYLDFYAELTGDPDGTGGSGSLPELRS